MNEIIVLQYYRHSFSLIVIVKSTRGVRLIGISHPDPEIAFILVKKKKKLHFCVFVLCSSELCLRVSKKR